MVCIPSSSTTEGHIVKVDERAALRILVVDDDDADALMIEEALEAADRPAVVDRVADGREALRYLRQEDEHASAERPDIVLLDLNMPGMHGREVLSEIKSDRDLTAIPVVVLTTSGEAADIVESYRHQASAYVTKPIDLDSFEAVVREINRFYRDTAVLPRG